MPSQTYDTVLSILALVAIIAALMADAPSLHTVSVTIALVAFLFILGMIFLVRRLY